MPKDKTNSAILIVLIAGILWSFGALVVRYIEDARSVPWQYLFFRGLTIFFLLNLYLFIKEGKSFIKNYQKIDLSVVIGGMGFATAFIGFIWSITRTTNGFIYSTFWNTRDNKINTKSGPKILEVTPRLSGGFDSQKTTPISSGRNFIRAAMRLSLGLPIDKNDFIHKQKKFSAVWAILPNSGKIKSINGINEVKKMKGIKEIIILKNKNDKIPKIINNAQRPAYVISEAETHEQALRIAQNGASKIKFRME